MAEWNQEWATDEWMAEVQEWVSMVLGSYEIAQHGPLEPGRARLWATRVTVNTDHGRLYFKANNPGQIAEAAVTATAAKLAPDQLVMPLAIEPLRGWMLSPDYGDTLAALPATDYQLWARIVRDFARVQHDLLPFGDTLFDHGLLQLDPAWLPSHIDEQLLLHASMPPQHPLHLPERDAEELHRGLGTAREMCAALAAGPVPLSLVHHELTRAHTFIPAAPDEPLRFLSLSGAYWAHPFSVLGPPLREMCRLLRTTADDARVRRVVAAYLEQWSEYGTVEELRPLVEPALRAGRMQEHGIWMRILSGASDADVERYAPEALAPLAGLVRPGLD